MSNSSQSVLQAQLGKLKEASQVLIIDDVDEMRDMLKLHLTQFGFKAVFEAENANKSLNICKSAQIDLAFLDINLPDLNGYDLYVQLKSVNPDIHIIVVSGEASLNNVREAKRLGANGFISKPYHFDRIKPLLFQFFKQKIENQ